MTLPSYTLKYIDPLLGNVCCKVNADSEGRSLFLQKTFQWALGTTITLIGNRNSRHEIAYEYHPVTGNRFNLRVINGRVTEAQWAVPEGKEGGYLTEYYYADGRRQLYLNHSSDQNHYPPINDTPISYLAFKPNGVVTAGIGTSDTQDTPLNHPLMAAHQTPLKDTIAALIAKKGLPSLDAIAFRAEEIEMLITAQHTYEKYAPAPNQRGGVRGPDSGYDHGRFC